MWIGKNMPCSACSLLGLVLLGCTAHPQRWAPLAPNQRTTVRLPGIGRRICRIRCIRLQKIIGIVLQRLNPTRELGERSSLLILFPSRKNRAWCVMVCVCVFVEWSGEVRNRAVCPKRLPICCSGASSCNANHLCAPGQQGYWKGSLQSFKTPATQLQLATCFQPIYGLKHDIDSGNDSTRSRDVLDRWRWNSILGPERSSEDLLSEGQKKRERESAHPRKEASTVLPLLQCSSIHVDQFCRVLLEIPGQRSQGGTTK